MGEVPLYRSRTEPGRQTRGISLRTKAFSFENARMGTPSLYRGTSPIRKRYKKTPTPLAFSYERGTPVGPDSTYISYSKVRSTSPPELTVDLFL